MCVIIWLFLVSLLIRLICSVCLVGISVLVVSSMLVWCMFIVWCSRCWMFFGVIRFIWILFRLMVYGCDGLVLCVIIW